MYYANGDKYDGQWLNNDQWIGKMKYKGKWFWTKERYGNFYKRAEKAAKKEQAKKDAKVEE